MRLHAQLGGPEPDAEVENELARQRHEREDGVDGFVCKRCREYSVPDEDELCAECVQEIWEAREQDYYDNLAKENTNERG